MPSLWATNLIQIDRYQDRVYKNLIEYVNQDKLLVLITGLGRETQKETSIYQTELKLNPLFWLFLGLGQVPKTFFVVCL